jgi:hypothetical protein
VAGLGRAPAVTKRENLPTSPYARDQRLSHRIRSWLERSDAVIDDFLVLAEMRFEILCWHARIIRVRTLDASSRTV